MPKPVRILSFDSGIQSMFFLCDVPIVTPRLMFLFAYVVFRSMDRRIGFLTAIRAALAAVGAAFTSFFGNATTTEDC